jgi:hypothetical protein
VPTMPHAGAMDGGTGSLAFSGAPTTLSLHSV